MKEINIKAVLDRSQLDKDLDALEKETRKIDVDVSSDGVKQTKENVNQLNQTVKTSNSMFSKLKTTINDTFSGGKVAMTAYLAVLNSIRKAAKEAQQTITELDESVTDLSIAMGESRSAATNYLSTLNAQAKELASTTQSVAEAADDWIRAGRSLSESDTLIKYSTMLSVLGQISSSSSTEDLLAVMNGYDMSVDELGEALDALVSIDLKAATSSGDIATALKYCASSADLAGVSFNKLAAMIGTVQDKTQQSAETVGTFMNTLLSRYRNVSIGTFVDDDGEDLSEVETILNSLGIQLRESNQEFRDFEDVIDDVATNWNTYSSVQQAAIAKAFSGTRQQSRFIALMEGYNETLELTTVAAESAGTAVSKYESSYLDSLEAKQNQLQASFESMILNSDMTSVYAGIIDATNALVEFIDETNSLKGILGGALFAGTIKAFLSIKTGVMDAYTTLNKFQNALDIVNSTKISTSEYNRLLTLSNGLSTSQMKLVLSTDSLTLAQKKELLIASGLSEEEATLQLQTWKMTTANTGLTASTTSLSTAFKGLTVTLAANPLMLVVTAVTVAISAFSKYKQSLEELDQAASEAASTYQTQAESLDDMVSTYQDLHEQLLAAQGDEEETQAIKEQLLELQQELNDTYGDEYEKLNLVTDAYKDQTEAIEAYSKKAANTFLNENRKGLERAEKKMTSDKTYSLGTMNGFVDADEIDILNQIKEIASNNGIDFINNGFEFTGNAEDAYNSINAFMTDLRELQEQSGETSDVLNNIFDGLFNKSSKALSKADSVIEEYGDTYEQKQLAEIASSDELSSKYNEVTDAVEKYNNAVATSDNIYDDENVKSAYDNLQGIKEEISDNSDWDNYRNVLDDTFSEADDATYTFYEALQENKDGVGDLANELNGLSETDLQSMVDDGDNGDVFDKLRVSADEYGVTVDELISLLVKLGIVQGEIANSSNEEYSVFSLSDDQSSAIDDFQTKIQTLGETTFLSEKR